MTRDTREILRRKELCIHLNVISGIALFISYPWLFNLLHHHGPHRPSTYLSLGSAETSALGRWGSGARRTSGNGGPTRSRHSLPVPGRGSGSWWSASSKSRSVLSNSYWRWTWTCRASPQRTGAGWSRPRWLYLTRRLRARVGRTGYRRDSWVQRLTQASRRAGAGCSRSRSKTRVLCVWRHGLSLAQRAWVRAYCCIVKWTNLPQRIVVFLGTLIRCLDPKRITDRGYILAEDGQIERSLRRSVTQVKLQVCLRRCWSTVGGPSWKRYNASVGELNICANIFGTWYCEIVLLAWREVNDLRRALIRSFVDKTSYISAKGEDHVRNKVMVIAMV